MDMSFISSRGFVVILGRDLAPSFTMCSIVWENGKLYPSSIHTQPHTCRHRETHTDTPTDTHSHRKFYISIFIKIIFVLTTNDRLGSIFKDSFHPRKKIDFNFTKFS